MSLFIAEEMSQSAFSCQNNDNFNIFEGKVKLTAIAPEWSYADGKIFSNIFKVLPHVAKILTESLV